MDSSRHVASDVDSNQLPPPPLHKQRRVETPPTTPKESSRRDSAEKPGRPLVDSTSLSRHHRQAAATSAPAASTMDQVMVVQSCPHVRFITTPLSLPSRPPPSRLYQSARNRRDGCGDGDVDLPAFHAFPSQDVCRAAEFACDDKAGDEEGWRGDSNTPDKGPLPFQRMSEGDFSNCGAIVFGLSSTRTGFASPTRTDPSVAATTAHSNSSSRNGGPGRMGTPSSSSSSVMTVTFGPDVHATHSRATRSKDNPTNDDDAQRSLQRTVLGCFSIPFAYMLCRDADQFLELAAGSCPPYSPGSLRDSLTSQPPPPLRKGIDGGEGGGTEDARRHSSHEVIPLLTSLFYSLQRLEVHLDTQRKALGRRLLREAADARRRAEDEVCQEEHDLNTVLGARRKRGRGEDDRTKKVGPRQANADAEGHALATHEEHIAAFGASALDMLKSTVISEKALAAAKRDGDADEAGQARIAAASSSSSAAAATDEHIRSKRLREKARREQVEEQQQRQRHHDTALTLDTPRTVRESRKRVHALWQQLLALCPAELLKRGYVEWWLRHEMNNGSGTAMRKRGRAGAPHTNTDQQQQQQQQQRDPEMPPRDVEEKEERRPSAREVFREEQEAAYGIIWQREASRELYWSLLALLRDAWAAPGGLMHDRLAWAHAEDVCGGKGCLGATSALCEGTRGTCVAIGGGGGSPSRFVFTPCASLANTPHHHQHRGPNGRRSETPVADMARSLSAMAMPGSRWTGTSGPAALTEQPPSPAPVLQDFCFLPGMTAVSRSWHVPHALQLVLALLPVLLSLYPQPPQALADLVEDTGACNHEVLLGMCQLLNQIPMAEILSAASEAGAGNFLLSTTAAADTAVVATPSSTPLSPRTHALLLLAGQGLRLAATAAVQLARVRTALRPHLTAYLSRLSLLRRALTRASAPQPGRASGEGERLSSVAVNGSAPAEDANGRRSLALPGSPQSPLTARQHRQQTLPSLAPENGVGIALEDFNGQYACVASTLPYAE